MHAPTVGNLVVDGEPERVPGRVVTPSFFEVLGVAPARGRTFVTEEGKPGADPVDGAERRALALAVRRRSVDRRARRST